jgi:hypothetical protein
LKINSRKDLSYDGSLEPAHLFIFSWHFRVFIYKQTITVYNIIKSTAFSVQIKRSGKKRMSAHPDVPGEPTTGTALLETATAAVQSFGPAKKIHQHLCA